MKGQSTTKTRVLKKIVDHVKVHNLFEVDDYTIIKGSCNQYDYVLSKGHPHNGVEGNPLNREIGFYVDIYFNEFTLTHLVDRELILTGKMFRDFIITQVI